MDGTTAGNLGFATPQPQQQPPVGTGGLFVNHSATSEAPAEPQAVSPQQLTPAMPPVQPAQYSQLTPVYAPGPSNSVTDIPQPAVKGIEFVKTPTPVQPSTIAAPVAQPDTMPQPMTPPVSAAGQLIQPVLSPSSPPMPPAQPPQMAQPAQPAMSTSDVPGAGSDVGVPPSTVPTELTIQKIENTDLDQMVNAVPATPVNAPEASPPVATAPAMVATSYFPSTTTPQGDIILVGNDNKRHISKRLVLKIVIITAVVLVLAGGGYFVYTNFINTKKSQPATSTTSTTQTPTVSQPSFTQTPATTTTTAPVTASSAPVTTDTATATTTAPAATASSTPATSTAPAPATTTAPAATTSTPAVANTGLDW